MIDLACGNGGHLLRFSQRGISARGNDISSAMLIQAKDKLGRAGYGEVPLTNFPMQTIPSEKIGGPSFELATAFYTALGYLWEPSDLNLLVRNLKRILNPGGFLFADLWNGHKMAEHFSPHRVITRESETHYLVRESNVIAAREHNALKVEFIFRVTNKLNNTKHEFIENHMLRYHTVAEWKSILLGSGFELVESGPFFDAATVTHEASNFFIFAKLVE